MTPNPANIKTAEKAMETVAEKCLMMEQPKVGLGAVQPVMDKAHVLAQALESRIGHLGLGA